jgi:hypothetical protein
MEDRKKNPIVQAFAAAAFMLVLGWCSLMLAGTKPRSGPAT